MAETGGAATQNVGTLTATYKIDATQGTAQIGTIMQQAEQIKVAMGNVQFKMDMGNSPEQFRQIIDSVTQLKNAQAQQATNTAALRAVQVQQAETIAATRVQQLLMAEASRMQLDIDNQAKTIKGQVNIQIAEEGLNRAKVNTQIRDDVQVYNQLSQAQKLQADASKQAMAAQKQAADAAASAAKQALALQQQQTKGTDASALAAQRLATAQLATEQKELQVELARTRVIQEQLSATERDGGAATDSLSQKFGGYIETLKQGAIFGAAFRAGEMAMQTVFQTVKATIDETIGSAINWEAKLNEIQNNTTQTTADNKAMDESIRALAATTDASMSGMADGYRHISSEGFNAADAQKILNEATMSAVSTGSDEEQTVNLLAQTMHIFGANVNEAAGYMNVLHLSAAEGNTTLQEFVTMGSRAITTAASLGVSVTDVASAMSALTREGYSVQQASTMLVSIMKGIADPTAAARKEIMALSQATGVDLVYDFSAEGLAAKGLTPILNDVKKATAGNNEELLKILPNLRGGLGEVVLLGQGWSDYNAILQSNAQTMAGQTNPTLDAYNRTVNTTAFQVGVLRNEFTLFETEIGTRILPLIKTLTEDFQRLLQAMGVDFHIPGFEQFSQQAQAASDLQKKAMQDRPGAEAATGNANPLEGGGNTAAYAVSQQQIANANDLATAQNNLADAERHLRDLAIADAPNENALAEATAKVKSITDQYQPQITRGEDTIRQINIQNPDDIARTVKAEQLKLDELNIKINKPDTTDLDKSIDDTKAKIDNLADADTTAVDARITDLQNKITALGAASTDAVDQQIIDLRGKLAGIGNTTGLDREIQDLQAKLNAPAQSTAAQESGMTTLEAQLATGQISQASFGQQYGTLARQRQGIVEQNTTAKTAIQQQILDLQTAKTQQDRNNQDEKDALNAQLSQLDLQKQQTELTNRIAVEGLQKQLDAAKTERETIIKTHDDQVKFWEKQIKQWDLEKTARLAPYNAALAQNAKEQDTNQLYIDRAKAQRDLLTIPIQAQIDGWKNSMDAALEAPKQAVDYYQNLVNLNKEDTRSWQAKKDEATNAIQSIKASVADLNKPGPGSDPNADGAGAPEGMPSAAPLVTTTNISPEPKYGQEHFDAAAGQRADGLTLWIDNLNTKIREFGDYLVVNLPNIINTLKSTVTIDVSTFFTGVDFVRTLISLIADFNDGDWGAVRKDLTELGKDLSTNAPSGAGINELEGAFGSGTGADRPTPSGQMPGPYNTDIGTDIVVGNPSFTDPPLTIGGKTPMKAIGDVLGPWLNRHGLGGGQQHVEGADLGGEMGEVDSFVQHIQDQLGDGSAAQQAIQSFRDQIMGEMGQGSSAQQAVKDAEDAFNSTFGTSGSDNVPSVLSQFGEDAGKVFAPGGTLDQYIANNGSGAVPSQLMEMQQAFQKQFGGGLQNPVTAWMAFMGTQLSTGGTIGGYLGNSGSLSQLLTSLQTMLNGTFGTPGSGAQKPIEDYSARLTKAFGTGQDADQLLGPQGAYDMTVTNADQTTSSTFGAQGTGISYIDQFVAGMTDAFKTGGSVSEAMAPFGAVMTAGFQPGVDAINTFMTALAGAIQQVGQWFGDASLSGISWQNIGGGGAQAIHATVGAGKVGAANPAVGGTGSQGAHANGLSGGMPGHWAMIGERGPEAMYVPPGATIIPNHLLPGHADGLVGATLGDLALGGALGPVGASFENKSKSDLAALIARLSGAQRAGGAFASGALGDTSGVPADLLAAVRAITSNPREEEVALMASALETSWRNIWQIGGGPGAGYWQIEAGAGNSNSGLSVDDAFDPLTAFRYMYYSHNLPGAIARVDPGMWSTSEEQAFVLAAHYFENGPMYTNPEQIANAWALMQPVLASFVGPTAVNGIANVEGMSGDALINIARGDLVGKFGWCEQYVGDVMQAAGLRYARASSAEQHAHLQPLNAGRGPLGAITFFPDKSGLGHVAFSLGNDQDVWGTIAGGTQNSQVGVLNTAGWDPYGWTDNPRYNGGYITEPTLTLGMYSGKRGSLGERGIEQVVPNGGIRPMAAAGTTITIGAGAVVIQVMPGEDPYSAGKRGGQGFIDALREKGHNV